MTDCPNSLLERFADGTLPSQLIDQVAAHLDQCPCCCAKLASLEPAQDLRVLQSALTEPKLERFPERSVRRERFQRRHCFDPVEFMLELAPTDDPQSMGRLGQFEVTGVVGFGGMGVVLKAREISLDRIVAIKVLMPHLATSITAKKRFEREAKAAAAIIHDNVIEIYQVAKWNDLPYLVMPYVPDESLQQKVDREGKLDLEDTLSIGIQIAKGLAAAHEQGLIHRDVKPSNVLIAKGTGRAIITDFGLARSTDDPSLTLDGAITGTPHYMSPEQARREKLTSSSDLFSLGSAMLAMATGDCPVEAESGTDAIYQIGCEKIPSLAEFTTEYPDWFVRLVDWLRAKNPGSRPTSATQVAQLMQRCLAHVRQPNEVRVPYELRRFAYAPKSFGRSLVVSAIGFGLGLILIYLIGLISLPSNPRRSSFAVVSAVADGERDVLNDIGPFLGSSQTAVPIDGARPSVVQEVPQPENKVSLVCVEDLESPLKTDPDSELKSGPIASPEPTSESVAPQSALKTEVVKEVRVESLNKNDRFDDVSSRLPPPKPKPQVASETVAAKRPESKKLDQEKLSKTRKAPTKTKQTKSKRTETKQSKAKQTETRVESRPGNSVVESATFQTFVETPSNGHSINVSPTMGVTTKRVRYRLLPRVSRPDLQPTVITYSRSGFNRRVIWWRTVSR